MKIKDAKQMYSAQLNTLWDKRQALSKLLKEQEKSGTPSFDRVELSRELSEVDAQYEAVQGVMEGITTTKNAIRDAEVAKQQNETLAKAAEDLAKIMEIFRRISSGAKVPGKDEQKLMEYDFKLYMAAKQAALLAQRNDEEYDSLWDDEEEPEEQTDPAEVAGNSDISVPRPENVTVEAAAAEAVSDVS